MGRRTAAPTSTGAAAPVPYSQRKTDADVPDDEKALVGKLLGKIQRAIEMRKTFDETTLPRLRRLAYGTENANSTEATTRANLVFSTIATMMPHVYAKNPEIAITPSEAVQESDYEKWKAFCKTAQAFLNRVLIDEAGLKRRAKANVRSAMGTSIGWLKMSFQKNPATDPLILKRTNDMQDNLRRIEQLIEKAEDTDRPQLESEREELRHAIAAQQQSNEVRVFKGFTIDRVQTEDIFVLDESVVEFDDYVNADMIAHRVWMSDETYEANFGVKPLPSATPFGQPSTREATDESGQKVSFSSTAGATNYRAVFEIWDKTKNTLYTVAMGQAGYCRAPYTPESTPQRWYSFYGLAFNLVEGRFRPLSDTELIQHLQEEYSTTRYLYAEARKEAIPTRVFRKSGSLTPEDIDKMSKRKARDWIGIEGNPQIPLTQEFMQLDGVKIDPAAYDVSIIRNDIDMMVGLSDASRANLIQAKTATEAEIMRQALMNRVAERQDTNEDMISDMARAALEISLQEFTTDEVKQVVGEGAVWRDELTDGRGEPLGIESIFHNINAMVRAGSTGRPNQMKEREQWTQLMPVINETMQSVAELRAQGMDDLADAKMEILRETLRRFDERLDIDSILPKAKEQLDEQGQPIPPAAQMMKKAQEAMQQAQAASELVQQIQTELQECQRQLEIAKQAEQARVAEAEAKVAIETANATAKQEIEEARLREAQAAETERERIRADAQQKIEDSKRDNERYSALVQAAASIVAAQMKPAAAGEGEAGGEGGEPDTAAMLTAVMEKLASVTDRLAAQLGAG